MTDRYIKQQSLKFRSAIEKAKREGRLSDNILFRCFPKRCCREASFLLAEYLKEKGINTILCFNQLGDCTHTWLVVNDNRVTLPSCTNFSWPKEIRSAVKGYGIENPDEVVDTTRYNEDNLQNGLIIDITADQFKGYNTSVYVGYLDDFHKSFDFQHADNYEELNAIADDYMLSNLYQVIEYYID